MTMFSIEAGSRWDAIDLQGRLGPYSPWLIELTHGRWYVRGSVRSGSHDDVQAVLDRWAVDRSADVPPVVYVDAGLDAGDGPLL